MNDESQTTFCGKPFGANQPPLIIAEVGFNHNGDVELAR
jgi:sialic acid synthase SpsE